MFDREDYTKQFLPLEPNNVRRDQVHEAHEVFIELKLAPFDARLNDYVLQVVVLNARKAFGDSLIAASSTDLTGLLVACRIEIWSLSA